MIKPMEEYSPKEREFVEFAEDLRSRPPKPPHDPGPSDGKQVKAIIVEKLQDDCDEFIEATRGRKR